MSVLGVSERGVSVRAATPRSRPGFGHQPALDGVRGLSVLLVLLFHGGWSWITGGYVGVSVFFTLSGFLITRLLLDEHANHGRINVVRFWSKRMRRLLPASMICLAVVAVLGNYGAFGDVPGLGHDLIGSVFQIANWFQLTGGVSYSESIFGARSPLDHYWSLAIEEQFYWLWPLAMVAILRRKHPHRIVLGVALVAMAAAPLVAWLWGSDAAYWATPARVGEILVGAGLAVVLDGRHRHRLGRPAAVVSKFGWLGLAAIVWAAVTWPSDSGPAYAGWFPVLAVASAALILGLQVPSGLRRSFSFRPLVWLGAISYGVYLYHWPIFMLVDRHGPTDHLTRFAIQMVITLLVAAASYRWLEFPIRRGAGSRRQLAPVFAVSGLVVVVIAGQGSFAAADRFAEPDQAVSQLEPVDSLVALTPLTTTPDETPPPEPSDAPERPIRPPGWSPFSQEPAETTIPASTQPPVTEPPATGDVAVAAVPPRPVRVLVVGDSTAWSLGDGLAEWAAAHPDLASVSLSVSPGCGFIATGSVPADDGSGYAGSCRAMLGDQMMQSIGTLQPDVVLLMASRTDVKDRVWDAAEGTLPNSDRRFQERQLSDYRDLTTWILGTGVAKVIWVEPLASRPDPAPADETTDQARIDVLHDVIGETVATADPARVSTLDLAGWYLQSGLDDVESRGDGIHFDLDAATVIADRLVGPSIVNTALS